MPRAGLTAAVIVATAADLVDEAGAAALTLVAVAERHGVRPPSLYNHVDGLADLRRRVAVDAVDRLAEACRAAAMGRSGPEALGAVAIAYRSWALDHPGTYALIQVARPGDEEWERSAGRLLEPIIAILAGMGVDGDDAIHATRAFRSALHGFVMLETGSGFGIDLPVETSFHHLVDTIVAGIARSPT
jgi:AcrR family transcriptional regulator